MARIHGTPSAVEEVPPDAVGAYENAIRVVALGAGARAVIHPYEDASRKSIAATLFKGSRQKVFLAAGWLRSESIPVGMNGQVFAIAPLRGGDAVASVAWVDAAQQVHGDLVVLDSDLKARRHFEVPGGVREVVAGPEDTFIAVTFDAKRHSRDHGAPLLTLFDHQGKRLAEFLPLESTVTAHGGIAIANLARLVGSGNHYALLDTIRGQATQFRVDRAAGRFVFTVERQFSIDSAPAGVSFVGPGIGAASIESGDVIVTRQGYRDHEPATLIVKYTAAGTAVVLAASYPPWRAVFTEDGEWKGVVQSGDITLIQTADVPLIYQTQK